MKKIFYKIGSPPLICAIISFLIMVIVLCIYPKVGLADNGKFHNTLNAQGLYKLDKYQEDEYFSYFSSQYGVYEYFNEYQQGTPSTFDLLFKVGMGLDNIFTKDEKVFDIRFVSILLIIYNSIFIYLVVDFVSYKKTNLIGYITGAIAIVIFADTGYTTYFNSLYKEGFVYVTFLMMAICLLLVTQKRYSTSKMLIMVLLNVILLIGSKYENVPTEALKYNTSKLHSMTRGAMITSENPENTAQYFDINSQYSMLNKENLYDRYPEVNIEGDVLKKGFMDKYNAGSLAVYYMSNPGQFMEMLDKGAKESYRIRPESLGNFERSANKDPGAKTGIFALYSMIKDKYAPKTAGFLIVWFLLIILFGYKDVYKTVVLLLIAGIGLTQVVLSGLFSGDLDFSNYVFLYNVAFDFVTYIGIAAFVAGFSTQTIKKIKPIKSKTKSTVTAAVILMTLIFVPSVNAESKTTDAIQEGVIVYKKIQEAEYIQGILKSCGISPTLIQENDYEKNSEYNDKLLITTSKIPLENNQRAEKIICLGEETARYTGIEYEEITNMSISIYNENYKEPPQFEKSAVLAKYIENNYGEISSGQGEKYSFAVENDGKIYIPYYREHGVSLIILATLIETVAGHIEGGSMYVLLDEIYPFSDLENLSQIAEQLYAAGIPFIARIMPIYNNLNYPAMERYLEVLKYLESINGTIVIHDPIVNMSLQEVEPLEEKMDRFNKVLKDNNIHVVEMPVIPYELDWGCLINITSNRKQFGELAFDTMIMLPFEDDIDSSYEKINILNKKWFSFGDYKRKYTNESYLYKTKKVKEDYLYKEKQEGEMKEFFDKTNNALIGIVAVSILVLVSFVLIGRTAYKKKFYK